MKKKSDGVKKSKFEEAEDGLVEMFEKNMEGAPELLKNYSSRMLEELKEELNGVEVDPNYLKAAEWGARQIVNMVRLGREDIPQTGIDQMYYITGMTLARLISIRKKMEKGGK